MNPDTCPSFCPNEDSGEYSTLPVVLEQDLDVEDAGRVIATMVFESNGHSGG